MARFKRGTMRSQREHRTMSTSPGESWEYSLFGILFLFMLNMCIFDLIRLFCSLSYFVKSDERGGDECFLFTSVRCPSSSMIFQRHFQNSYCTTECRIVKEIWRSNFFLLHLECKYVDVCTYKYTPTRRL